jgi:hypothetical protein
LWLPANRHMDDRKLAGAALLIVKVLHTSDVSPCLQPMSQLPRSVFFFSERDALGEQTGKTKVG